MSFIDPATFTAAPLSYLAAANQILIADTQPTLAQFTAGSESTWTSLEAALRRTLDYETRRMQAEYAFLMNLERNVKKDPSGGYIALDTNTAFLMPSREHPIDFDVVERYHTGDGVLRLYNLKDHTFTFSSSIYLDIVYIRDFIEIPEPYKLAIVERATEQFLVSRNATQAKLQKASQNRMRMDILCQRDSVNRKPFSLLDGFKAAEAWAFNEASRRINPLA